MTGGFPDMVEMAVMGLDTAVVAPLLVWATRRRRVWSALTPPAWVALPAFLVVHAGVTIWMAVTMPAPLPDLAVHVALVACSILFWLPVLSPTRRLSDGGRMIYLFIAMPTMDLAGVFVVLHGDAAGGLAMIVAMLPVGVCAVLFAWRWILAEERNAVAAERLQAPIPLQAAGGTTGALR